MPTRPTSPKTVRQREEEQQELRLGWRMAGLAFTMASEAAAGALLGWVIDYFAGTGSTWLLIGSITGIVIGMLSFIRGAFQLNKLLAKQEPRHIKPLAADENDDASEDH